MAAGESRDGIEINGVAHKGGSQGNDPGAGAMVQRLGHPFAEGAGTTSGTRDDLQGLAR
jgi:hypothetical protein